MVDPNDQISIFEKLDPVAESHLNPVVFSRKSDNWNTPRLFLSYLSDYYNGPFFDPCPAGYVPDGPIPDGLNVEWELKNFVNPPYSKIRLWAKKAYDEFMGGRYTVFLCPARTDTRYFHQYLIRCQEISFIEGRLKFNESGPAPFPSMVCIFDPARRGRHMPEISVITKADLATYAGQDDLDQHLPGPDTSGGDQSVPAM